MKLLRQSRRCLAGQTGAGARAFVLFRCPLQFTVFISLVCIEAEMPLRSGKGRSVTRTSDFTVQNLRL